MTTVGFLGHVQRVDNRLSRAVLSHAALTVVHSFAATIEQVEQWLKTKQTAADPTGMAEINFLRSKMDMKSTQLRLDGSH